MVLERRLYPLFVAAFSCACVGACTSADNPSQGDTESSAYTTGKGVLVFAINDSTKIEIPAERHSDALILHNGEETLRLSTEDSSCYRVPIFSGLLCLDHSGRGNWTDVLRIGDDPYRVPCSWQTRAHSPMLLEEPDTSAWRLSFGSETPWYGDLHLRLDGRGTAEATIETATGDFRFLHGSVKEGQITLQTFDGAHLFLFTGAVEGDRIVNGWFASGIHFGTPFTGLPLTSDAPSLSSGQRAEWTGLDVKYQGKTRQGNEVAWSWDSAQGDTVHVLSIMGSWCPNCLDEHRLLMELMREFPLMKVHTLAFERGIDAPSGEKRALNRLKDYSEQMELWRHPDRWSVTLAGPASKTEAQKRLPFIDRVVSFPTTIVLHPGAEEPWIHSGFNGPATGVKYDLEKSALAAAINGLTESH